MSIISFKFNLPPQLHEAGNVCNPIWWMKKLRLPELSNLPKVTLTVSSSTLYEPRQPDSKLNSLTFSYTQQTSTSQSVVHRFLAIFETLSGDLWYQNFFKIILSFICFFHCVGICSNDGKAILGRTMNQYFSND